MTCVNCASLAAATKVVSQSRTTKRITITTTLSTKSRVWRVMKNSSRLCFIRKLMPQTMKPSGASAVRLRIAEPVAQAKLFEVLSGEQF